jgi:adenylate cyclase
MLGEAAPADGEAMPANAPDTARETNADQGEETSFRLSETPLTATRETAASPQNLVDSAGALIESLLEKERGQLFGFAEASLAVLTAARPQLQAFERVGLNLYLSGAASVLSERGSYGENIKLDLLRKAVEHTGTNAAVAEAFVQRLEAALQRPRFRKLADAGREAMTALLDPDAKTPLPPLPELIGQWADPNVRGAEVKKVTFLLTDIVGSTALTSKVGNAGAQRVVRAHNAAVRAATKNFRGTEIKHTGDGMLLTFPDAAAAARAAIEIQQDATNYAKDNPDAPLVLRIGVHTGEAGYEEGEYFGPALGILNGVCAAAGENQIFTSEEVKTRCVGPAFRFQDIGRRKLKGPEQEAALFKLEWTPKSKAVKGPLEYGQIGGKKASAGL